MFLHFSRYLHSYNFAKEYNQGMAVWTFSYRVMDIYVAALSNSIPRFVIICFLSYYESIYYESNFKNKDTNELSWKPQWSLTLCSFPLSSFLAIACNETIALNGDPITRTHAWPGVVMLMRWQLVFGIGIFRYEFKRCVWQVQFFLESESIRNLNWIIMDFNLVSIAGTHLIFLATILLLSPAK